MALENVQGRICLDIDECDKPSLRRECARLGGVCTNRPGDYACLCPSGQPCIGKCFNVIFGLLTFCPIPILNLVFSLLLIQ